MTNIDDLLFFIGSFTFFSFIPQRDLLLCVVCRRLRKSRIFVDEIGKIRKAIYEFSKTYVFLRITFDFIPFNLILLFCSI